VIGDLKEAQKQKKEEEKKKISAPGQRELYEGGKRANAEMASPRVVRRLKSERSG